jgi:hypothetical protein
MQDETVFILMTNVQMSQNLMPLFLYVNRGRVWGETEVKNTENRHLKNSLKLSYNGSISERIQILVSYAVQTKTVRAIFLVLLRLSGGEIHPSQCTNKAFHCFQCQTLFALRTELFL